jgi:hypothetical protein
MKKNPLYQTKKISIKFRMEIIYFCKNSDFLQKLNFPAKTVYGTLDGVSVRFMSCTSTCQNHLCALEWFWQNDCCSGCLHINVFACRACE